jgi:hypothetical protein
MKYGEWSCYKSMSVVWFSTKIQLQELKDTAKQTTMRAGCSIWIENAISDREFIFIIPIILMSNYNIQRESNFDAWDNEVKNKIDLT